MSTSVLGPLTKPLFHSCIKPGQLLPKQSSVSITQKKSWQHPSTQGQTFSGPTPDFFQKKIKILLLSFLFFYFASLIFIFFQFNPNLSMLGRHCFYLSFSQGRLHYLIMDRNFCAIYKSNAQGQRKFSASIVDSGPCFQRHSYKSATRHLSLLFCFVLREPDKPTVK